MKTYSLDVKPGQLVEVLQGWALQWSDWDPERTTFGGDEVRLENGEIMLCLSFFSRTARNKSVLRVLSRAGIGFIRTKDVVVFK